MRFHAGTFVKIIKLSMASLMGLGMMQGIVHAQDITNLWVGNRQGVGTPAYFGSNIRLLVEKNPYEYGPMASSIFGYRPGHYRVPDTSFGGTAWTQAGVDAGVTGYSYFGNSYSAGVAALSFLDYENSAALFAAKQDGSYAAFLAYNDPSGNKWAGYFRNQVLIMPEVWTTNTAAKLALGDANHSVQAEFDKGLTLSTFGTNNCYIKLQQYTGNVSIGREPDASRGRLQVAGDARFDGKIYCKEMSVSTNVWADYVFEPGYDLKPLSEVETFIAKNKHLPGIPSQKEAIKNGVEVGQMQVKMLEKIEELTLHMIALRKENARLTERLERIEKDK